MAVIPLMAVGSIINTVHSVQVRADPAPSLIAAGFMTGALLFLSETVDPRLATAIAALYLLASFLFHGTVFINLATALSGAPTTKG